MARAALWDMIRARADNGAAVLVSTHYMDEAEQADRLVLMAKGEVAAEGRLEDIIGDQTAVEIVSDRWADVFAALDRPQRRISLAGVAVRLVGEDQADVERELASTGVSARVRTVPATLDETMVLLER